MGYTLTTNVFGKVTEKSYKTKRACLLGADVFEADADKVFKPKRWVQRDRVVTAQDLNLSYSLNF